MCCELLLEARTLRAQTLARCNAKQMADSSGFASRCRGFKGSQLRYASHYRELLVQFVRPAQQRTLVHSLEFGNAQPHVREEQARLVRCWNNNNSHNNNETIVRATNDQFNIGILIVRFGSYQTSSYDNFFIELEEPPEASDEENNSERLDYFDALK